MKKINFKGIEVRLFLEANQFAQLPEKPFGELPEGALFGGVVDDSGNRFCSTGFTVISQKRIYLFVDNDIFDFRDLLSTVSHELGHLIEGGFKKNPPQKRRYDSRHEAKADHYENFALDAYDLSKMIHQVITKTL
jgi:hypothetical protein